MGETRYVLGFLFAPEHEYGVLLQKSRGPGEMAGRLNGIGGHVEDGESPEDAMRREGIEEVGAVHAEWKPFCLMRGDGWVCDCFAAVSQDALEVPGENDVGEKVYCLPPSAVLLSPNLMRNVRWLLPMAMEADDLHAIVTYVDSKRGDR